MRTALSSRRCITKVGTAICGSRSRTSASRNASSTAEDAAGTGRRPQQPRPPGARAWIALQRPRKGFIPTGRPIATRPAPGISQAGAAHRDSLPPSSSCRAEQNEPGDAAGVMDRKFDAGRPAFGGAEQHDAARIHSAQHGADILRRTSIFCAEPTRSDSPSRAAIKHDEPPELHKRREKRPARGMLPGALHAARRSRA